MLSYAIKRAIKRAKTLLSMAAVNAPIPIPTQLQQQSRFLSLPAELIIAIVAHLSDDRAALCSLAQTCQHLQPLCEEHIYTVIELLSTDDLRDILEAFSRRPERIAAVHTLKILYKFHVGLATTVAERRDFNACVAKMNGLKDWHVESPYDNFHWEKGGNEWVEYDMEDFRTALEKVSYSIGQPLQADLGLAKLNKCRCHYSSLGEMAKTCNQQQKLSGCNSNTALTWRNI
jgi:hypothetical protein